MAAEVGDLCSRWLTSPAIFDADPEGVLRETNIKFERRFAAIERALAARGKTPKDASLAEMDALWDEAKAAEKAASAERLSAVRLGGRSPGVALVSSSSRR